MRRIDWARLGQWIRTRARFPLLMPLLMPLFTNCDAPRANHVTTSVTDSAGLRITRIDADTASLEQWSLAPTPDVVLTGDETGDSTALSPVGSTLWLATGTVVIADLGSRRLLVYDSAGVFQRALGRIGDGPGEFRSIGALSTPGGDTVAVFDATHRRLSYWHTTDGYLRTVSLNESASPDAWPADAWAWRDATIVVLQLTVTPIEALPPSTGLRKWPMQASLTWRDQTGRVLSQSSAFPGMYTGLYAKGDMRVAFSNNPFVAVAAERVYFGSGQAFTLSTLGPRFTSIGEIRWPAVQERMAPAEVNALRAEREAMVGGRLPPERLQRMLDMEFATELLPDSRPAIGRVLVDVEDRVWVERFEPARLGSAAQTPGNTWHVLDAAGRPVARIRLPARTRLEAARGRHVWVMQRDSVDVETVARFALVTR